MVATKTTASGFKPAILHLMSKNFCAPRSAPKPASVLLIHPIITNEAVKRNVSNKVWPPIGKPIFASSRIRCHEKRCQAMRRYCFHSLRQAITAQKHNGIPTAIRPRPAAPAPTNIFETLYPDTAGTDTDRLFFPVPAPSAAPSCPLYRTQCLILWFQSPAESQYFGISLTFIQASWTIEAMIIHYPWNVNPVFVVVFKFLGFCSLLFHIPVIL